MTGIGLCDGGAVLVLVLLLVRGGAELARELSTSRRDRRRRARELARRRKVLQFQASVGRCAPCVYCGREEDREHGLRYSYNTDPKVLPDMCRGCFLAAQSPEEAAEWSAVFGTSRPVRGE